jgi:hypothetical protein
MSSDRDTWLEDLEEPTYELAFLYCFDNGQIRKIEASLLGVIYVHKKSGQVFTQRGLLSDYGNGVFGGWYNSEENLLKSVSYEI